MKKVILTSAALMATLVASADVTIIFPKEGTAKQYSVSKNIIADMAKPYRERPAAIVDTMPVKKGKIVISTKGTAATSYNLQLGDKQSINFMVEPTENLTIKINSLKPLDYTMKGTMLMEGIEYLTKNSKKIVEEYNEVRKNTPDNKEELQKIGEKYDNLFTSFIKENPNNPAMLYALMNVGPELFLETYNNLSDAMKQSTLFPMLESRKKQHEASIEAEKKRKELESGSVVAPNFTLKDLSGKDVSLSDYRGKWVILDFWGGWCGWCIKGFPSLKEAYAKYKGEVEVIGIDCNESEEAWRKAVEKYQLPWVNVYNPVKGVQDGICKEYAVQGFPTKAIINPEGKIANITVGEDPAFFETLAKLLGK